MDATLTALMLFPAFLIGAAFGIMIVLVLAGSDGMKSKRPIILSVAGSAIGAIVFLLTASAWPPVVGPFILCPFSAALSAIAGRKAH